MAKYQQYAEYKDSGVEWLGDIPKDWQIKRLKYLCKINTGTKDTVNAIEDGIYPFFVRSQTVERINSYGADCEAVLTAGDGVGVGKVYHYINGKFDYHQRVYMLSEFNQITGRFLYYYLSSNFYKVALQGNAKSTVDSLRLPQFLNFEFSLPSLEEQPLIVSYLDHETAQIDTLIEKQQTLIQLLKEKRQAVISHAVTKGLNPDAPMKDSGVEWLGEVPEHWSVIKLSNYAIPLNGDRGANYPSGNDFVDEGVFFISTSEVVDGYIKTDTASKITLKKYNQLGGLKIKKGDIIYCLRGSVGKSGICTFNEGTISSSLMGIRSVSIEPYYLKLLLASSSELQQRSMLVTGSVSANLSAQNVMGYRFAIPEKVEQLMIIAHVENSLEKIDILLSKATQAIQLMQERRTALISAAVTGKIDVRGWRAPE